MLENTAATSIGGSLTSHQRIAAGLTAALLGMFMLFGVGFAHSDVVHNTAHDTRHAFTFPCH